MATAMNIEITLDDTGVELAFRKIQESAERAGQKGSQALRQINKDAKQAGETVQLLGRAFGVEVPQGLEKIIAKSPVMAAALAKMYPVAAAAQFAASVAQSVAHLDELEAKVQEVGRGFKVLFELATGLQSAELDAIRAEDVAAQLIPVQRQLQQVRNAAMLAGKEGFAEIDQQVKNAHADLKLMQAEIDAAAVKKFGYTETTLQIWKNARTSFSQMHQLVDQLGAAQKQELQRNIADSLTQSQAQINKIGKQGIALVLQEERDAIQMIPRLAAKGQTDAAAAIQQAHEKATKQIRELREDWSEQMEQVRGEAMASGLEGFAAIEQRTNARLAKMTEEFRKRFGETFIADPSSPDFETRISAWTQAGIDLNAAVNAVTAQGERERKELKAKNLRETTDLEQQAALAMLQSWERGYAQIVADAEQAAAQQRQLLAQTIIDAPTLATRLVAIEKIKNARLIEENRRMAEQLGGELESLFDDIGGGKLGQRMLANFKKMLMQMVAAWILSTNVMRGALGNILAGGIFGPGSTGASFFGGAGGGLPLPGMTGITGSAGGLGGLLGLGGGVPASSPIGATMPSSGGGIGTPGFGASASGATATSAAGGISSPGGGALTTVAAQTGASSWARFKGNLAGMLPLMGGLAGYKFGGTAGMIGVGTAGLLGAALMGNPQAMAAVQFLGAATTSGLIGGGIGFGVGSQHGALAGALSGAGSGALAGLLMGGPIGAAIGGIIGFFGGLFGGLFGGRRRRRQAEKFASEQSIEIQKIVDAYKGFEIDYGGALAQLETMRQNAYDQLRRLKGEGKKVYERTLNPRIDAARHEIELLQRERERRMGLVFGPPQFQSGGLIGGSRIAGWRLGNGQVLMIGHEGERVMNREASARHGSLLEKLNRGGNAGGGDTFNIYAIDAASFYDMLTKRGGLRAIRRAAKRAQIEGGF